MTTHLPAVPIAATDRVYDVLARDESLVDVFVRHAPHFSKLKNRAMRRVMARLITVEQAARTAGVPADLLLRELNEALGITHTAGGTNMDPANRSGAAAARGASERGGQGRPGGVADDAAHTRPRGAPVVELDVREDLRSGNEPFLKIMAAVAALGAGEVLRLRATFEPVPLFTVLGKRGFVHESLEHGADDWSVWFWRPPSGGADGADRSVGTMATTAASPAEPDALAAASPPSSEEPGAAAASGDDDDDDGKTVWLDVRGLNPPEPLMRTLAALETLPEGRQLIQVNARVPHFLFPMLAERGYACEVDESHADRVLVRIWRPE